MIEELLTEKIKTLETEINRRDDDENWQKKDENEYRWFHCGLRSFYNGMLQSMRDLLEELKCPKR